MSQSKVCFRFENKQKIQTIISLLGLMFYVCTYRFICRCHAHLLCNETDDDY
jgi:hypothetical protein